jgi:hypothetical protein
MTLLAAPGNAQRPASDGGGGCSRWVCVCVLQSTGLRGIAVWAVVNNGGNITIPWYNPNCTQGFTTLCNGLIGDSRCSQQHDPARLA